MAFVKRLGYYMLGFAIGILFLAYFLKEKNTTFCYTPNCRVLKNINKKKLDWTIQTIQFLGEQDIDSSQIRKILKEGDVRFSKSMPRKKPCPEYIIAGITNDKPLEILIQNCDSIASVEKIEIAP